MSGRPENIGEEGAGGVESHADGTAVGTEFASEDGLHRAACAEIDTEVRTLAGDFAITFADIEAEGIGLIELIEAGLLHFVASEDGGDEGIAHATTDAGIADSAIGYLHHGTTRIEGGVDADERIVAEGGGDGIFARGEGYARLGIGLAIDLHTSAVRNADSEILRLRHFQLTGDRAGLHAGRDILQSNAEHSLASCTVCLVAA